MIPQEQAHLFVAAVTHPGARGKNNEDRYAVSAHLAGPNNTTPSLLAVVSDGIGGHRAGEVAAEIAVETISQVVAASDAGQPQPVLREAFLQASQAIRARAEAFTEEKGMGATCVCAWVIGDRLYGASVGDSRLYLVRGTAVLQLTTDHTWVQEAIDVGVLTPEGALGHPNSHVIRRYLGSKTPPEPDFRLRLRQGESDQQAGANQGMRLATGDILVLCSDGLTDLVSQEEIFQALKTGPRETALQSLIDLANERGGHDNITVVVLEVPALSEETRSPSLAGGWLASNSPRLALACLGIAGLAAVAVLLVAGLIWLGARLADATPTQAPTPLHAVQSSPTPVVLPVLPAGNESPPGSLPTLINRATYTPWPTNTPDAARTPP